MWYNYTIRVNEKENFNMKVSENLELEYAKKKKGTEELEFMTRDRIKEFVAADLFIPVVQE